MATTPKQKEAEERKINQRRIDEALIDEVQKFPELYDPKQKDYKDVARKNHIWKEISINIGLDHDSSEDCRKRFRFLRGEYSRIKKAMKTKSGMAAAGKKGGNQSIYALMNFLDPYIFNRKVTSNLPQLEALKYDETDDPEEEDYLEKENPAYCPKRKSSEMPQFNAVLSKCEKILSEECDECSLFAKSLAEGLRHLSEEKRRLAMIKLQEVMYQIQFQT